MAKFCGKCGTALVDEKCPKCNSKEEKTKDSLIEILKKAFTKPVTSAIEMSKSNNVGLAWIIFIIKSILIGILLMRTEVNSDIKLYLSMILGCFIIENAFLGFMKLFFSKVFMIKIKYNAILMIIQFTSIISVLAMVLGTILCTLSYTLGTIISVLALLISFINSYIAFGEVAKEKKNYVGYAYTCAVAAVCLFCWICVVIS